ncbi:unnamed protein product [Allacma fusca]|uniref:HRDC domain-containing protein n=1 Tax=Allacma fusca TaxID=39272 RepID=A0A8J2LBR2_9HEXA|nr:unnamed protein product [Allacma fusca]
MSTLWSELVISLDLEGHEDRCFYGMTALLQISTSSTDFLINPFSLCEEISTEFRDYLEDIEGLVIMHGSSNDLLWLLRDFQIKIGTLFDIQDYYYVETGRFQAGLVEVAHYYTQSDLKTTHKDICQVADWTNQPLHKDLVQYARQDARLLLEIFEVIKSKDPKGILVPTTLQESRKRMKVHYKPKTYPTCGSQLGALRKRPVLPSKNEILLFILWEWRRIISCEFDDGPEYVIPFQKLVQLAVKCPSNVNEIELILRPMAESTKRSISSLLCVIQDGQPYLDKMKMIPCDICKKIGHVAVLCYRKGSQQDVKDWMKSHPQHKRAQNRRRRLNKKGNERTRKQEALCKMPEQVRVPNSDPTPRYSLQDRTISFLNSVKILIA